MDEIEISPCNFDVAVECLWTAMRAGRIDIATFNRIKPATSPAASPATRLRGLHALLGTADRLSPAVRVSLFDHISRGLPLFEGAL